MMRSLQVLVLLLTLVSVASAQSASSGHTGFHATFKTSNGKVITLDTRTGTLVTPRSRSTGLQDCSDKFQICLTDHHGFAFAYFRKCTDAADYKRLKFPPKIMSVLHNDIWVVFDAAPNYLFHYAYSKGIVGIFIGPTASFDFRSVFHDRNFWVLSLGAAEFRITSSETVAACSE